MLVQPEQPVTELLRAAQAGDAGAVEQLLAVVYAQLHQLARSVSAALEGRGGHIVQRTR